MSRGFFMPNDILKVFQTVVRVIVTVNDGPVAQLVEHLTFNEGVVRSNRTGLISIS